MAITVADVALIDVADVEVVYDDVRSRTMLRITNRRNGMTTVAIVELTMKQTVELLAAIKREVPPLVREPVQETSL